jgi:hypothetical protein
MSPLTFAIWRDFIVNEITGQIYEISLKRRVFAMVKMAAEGVI